MSTWQQRRRRTITLSFACPNADCEADSEMELEITPSRPAPPCSNPDSPAFSDDGDPGDCRVVGEDCCTACGYDFGADEKLMDRLWNEGCELLADIEEGEREAAEEARAEARREQEWDDKWERNR